MLGATLEDITPGELKRTKIIQLLRERVVLLDGALWESSILPEGVVERWFVDDGAIVAAGDRIAEVRIEGALHAITAPSGGRLTIVSATNAVVEPGSPLEQLVVDPSSRG